MQIRLPYLVEDVDRHGNRRRFVRKKGVAKIRIRDKLGTPEFMQAYEEALCRVNGVEPPKPQPRPVKQVYEGPKKDTMRQLVHLYQQSLEWGQLDARTQRVRQLILQHCMDEETSPGSGFKIGECPVAEFGADTVKLLRDRKKDKPAAAEGRMKAIRVLLKWAFEEGHVKQNVAVGIKPIKYKTDGIHSWTEEEVIQFAERHPVGSKARLAMSLMLFTGMRRSDAVLLGRKDVKDGCIKFKPTKTRKTTGVTLELPMLPELQAIIDESSVGKDTFLETEFGKPFTSNGFGNWFRDRCDEAGLPQCSAHGLRKAGAAIAAENGATEKQMMAIFGWDSNQLASYYAKKASQKKMAAAAMHLLIPKKKA